MGRGGFRDSSMRERGGRDTLRDSSGVGKMRLIDHRTQDGSRHFASLPKTCAWQALYEHILLLSATQITNFVAAGVVEPWMDFTYQGQRFSIRQQGGRYCFLVRDPQCPDLTLYKVASHCEKLLGGS
jgi:hypothetical protein